MTQRFALETYFLLTPLFPSDTQLNFFEEFGWSFLYPSLVAPRNVIGLVVSSLGEPGGYALIASFPVI